MNKLIYGLTGPTASGKTSLSISLAKAINAEIISVDSSLVYIGMDIGTSKPSIKKRAEIRHHLIDINQPSDSFSVSDFILNVNILKKEIWSRGKEVLLVGGTMLYFNSLICGLSYLPKSCYKIRESLELERQKMGLEYLYNQLNTIDIEYAKKISPNDKQRIFRAIEVFRISGKKYSDLIAVPKINGLKNLKLCALIPNNRSILYNNIKFRFKQMIKNGFLYEVQKLKNNRNLDINSTAMKRIGYRQAWQYLNGDINYTNFIDGCIVSTRHLAKNQLTWLRNWNFPIHIVSMENKNKEADILQYFGCK